MDHLNLDFASIELTEPVFKDVKFYVSGEVVPEVVEVLKKGGAERMNYFGDYVTHMLCGKDTEDTDLSDANEVYEVPAVTVKWVYMCAKLKRLVSTKPYLYSTNKLFDNCLFCLSKPEGDLKALWAMITYYGGLVQLNLDARCTHLVTVYTDTAKYEKAASLGPEKIAIVTPDWIIESIRNNALVQTDLFHPKLIKWPKIVKHESTTAITGFEPPEQEASQENLLETAPPDSTQALLDKLKQRMPWNQPQTTATTTDIVPPNVVAPSYTQTNKLPQMEQMRLFNQQQLNVASQQQQQQQQSLSFQQNTPNVVISNQQLPRSVVHHTAQPQQQFTQQQNIFQQLNQQQQGQLNLNRLIGQQQQQQQRPNLQTSMAQQLNKLNQLNQQQQTQFAQQLLQRNQLNLQNQQQQQQVVTNQVVQQQQQQPASVVQQNLIQRTAALGQLNKLQQLPHAQVIQHIQQIGAGNRQQIANQLLQNQQQQQLAQQLNQNQQLLQQQQQQQQNQVLTQQQINQNQVIVQQSQQLLNQNQLLQQKQQLLQNQQQNQQLLQQQFVQQSPQTVDQNQPQQQQQQQIGLIQNKITQQQFAQQQQQTQQQFVGSPQQQQPFVQNQQFVQQQQQQQPQQFAQTQQLLQQQPQQQLTGQPQLLNHQQLLISQQQTQQQQVFNQQQAQPNQTLQQRPINQHLWQQQQQQQQGQPQQIGIRHPGAIVQQTPQGPRVQWLPNQQQRQFIQLDAQTHQQLQQMAPEQRAAFVAKLQKQKQLLLQRHQIQMQQQRGGHILIRGSVPPGLNAQQQMQWLQQQAKQQGVVLQSNIQQAAIPQPAQEQPPPPLPQHAAPGLSPIQQQQQQTSPLFAAEQQKRIQLQQQQQQQQQYRLQQLQLQREQAQKNAAAAAAAAAAAVAQQQGGLVGAPQSVPQQQQQQQQQQVAVVGPPPPPPPPSAQGNVVRPIGQPQTAEVATAVVDQTVQQHPLVVNAKTKTALANMLSIRLQSGGATMGAGPEAIAEPSAAGTLRLMTAQHNAALNSAARPQDLLALQQRRQLSTPAPPPDLVRPPPTPVVPQSPQGEPPKLQYSPRAVVPLQHRPGTFYGHNPNLKLPPDLFLLGCIFVVVEVEKYLEETLPGWQQKIEKHGGEIEAQYCNRVTHVLCETQRHGVVMQALRDYKRCVTLYWLSDVIKRKQLLPPWTALHLPTMYLDTTPAAKHLISLSGFSGMERNRVKHMIKYTGASFTTYFSKHNTLLICAKAEGPKYMHAKKWGIPTVNVQWLTDVMLGNFSALNQMEHVKFQQFNNPPNFSFDPILVPNLMHPWKMPINISQDSYERAKRSSSPVSMPKKNKKLKTDNTDENDNETYVPSTNHRILFSMCADVEELKKIVKQLGGALATDHNDCTHLIMPYLARTNKLLYAVCRGIHILPESWVKDSQISNKFLDETNYTFDTKDFNSQYKCDFIQTLNTKNRNKLFEGRYFFVTPSVVPSKNVIVDLIHNCGGVVERIRRSSAQIEATNANAPYSYVIITHENDLHLVADLFKNKKEKIRTVCNVELILSAILRQTFEVEPYAVKIL